MASSSGLSENTLFNQWLPWVVSALIVLAMGYWVYVAVLPIFMNNDESGPVAVATQAKPVTRTTLNIENLDIFGAASGPAPPPPSTAEAKPTRLKLTLRGILATGDPKTGMAQIQSAKEEKYFLPGDSVFKQATLEEIYSDRVILLVDGAYETLLLPEEFLNNKAFEAARLRAERKKVATSYRDVFLSRVGSELIKLFGFKTKFRQGAFQGFIVTALGDKGREMMKTLGIEEGDMVVEVNGLRFSESLEATAQLKDLKDATEVDVIINRNGEELPFHFEFEKRVEEIVQIPEGMTKDEYEHQQVMAEPDFGETEEEQQYMIEQRAKFNRGLIGSGKQVEYDH